MRNRISVLLVAILSLVAFDSEGSSHGEQKVKPSTGPGPVAVIDPSSPALSAAIHHQVTPSDTDSQIGNPNNPHQVYVNNDGAGDLLFLFLPGHGQQPDQFDKLLLTAAGAGYHVIGLQYDNTHKLSNSGACGNDPDCFGPAHREIFDGQDHTPAINVGPHDSIRNRLIKLLQWLKAHYPNEHWGQFLQNGRPVWNKITAAGHSQGGGQAAMIAKLFNVHRAVMFASVVDATDDPSVSATWLTTSHATPIERYFAFRHVDDSVFPTIKVNWVTMGLLGTVTSVDGANPPYGGSHQLQSKIPMPAGVNAHNGVVVDDGPLTASGSPVYRPVWKYLIGP